MLKQNLSAVHILRQFVCVETHFSCNWNSNKDLCCSFLGKELGYMPTFSPVPSDYTDILTFFIFQHVSLKSESIFLSLCCHGCEKYLFHRTHAIYRDGAFIRLAFLSNHAMKEYVSMQGKWKEQRKKKLAHFYSQPELWILQYFFIFLLVILMIIYFSIAIKKFNISKNWSRQRICLLQSEKTKSCIIFVFWVESFKACIFVACQQN